MSEAAKPFLFMGNDKYREDAKLAIDEFPTQIEGCSLILNQGYIATSKAKIQYNHIYKGQEHYLKEVPFFTFLKAKLSRRPVVQKDTEFIDQANT